MEATHTWYLERSVDAAIAFLMTVNEALDAICKAPERYPKYVTGTHRCILPKFPFSLIYLNDPDTVKIVAVAHHKRRPGYWEERL